MADFVTFRDPENRLVLKAYLGDAKSIRVPDGIYKILPNAFFNTNVWEVYIPDSVEKICVKAFWRSGVRRVRLPAGLKKIEDQTFHGCWKLKEIEIPDSVEEIGSNAFNHCTFLTRLTLPAKTRIIGNYAFEKCANLEHIDFGGVEQIGLAAFCDCERLREVILPPTLKKIDRLVFSGCVRLERLSVPESAGAICVSNIMYCRELKKIECKAMEFYPLEFTNKEYDGIIANCFGVVAALRNLDTVGEQTREYINTHLKLYEDEIIKKVILRKDAELLSIYLSFGLLKRKKALSVLEATEDINLRAALIAYLENKREEDDLEL